jgi:hypothetical protein
MHQKIASRVLWVFLLLTSFIFAFASTNAAAQMEPLSNVNAPLGIYNIIQGVQVIDGELFAIATDPQGEQVLIPLSLTSEGMRGGRGPGPGERGRGPAPCPILDLRLGPINLELLGLILETSNIHLAITAHPGGGLLGRLLCGIARDLSLGIPLASILDGLNTEELNLLTSSLTELLNQALNSLNQATIYDVDETQTCPVLFLSLGPLNLTLLGLNIVLDDCTGGPVVVEITADPTGGILGQLLCALAGDGVNLQDLIGMTLQELINFLLEQANP